MTTTITIANPILHGMHPDPSWIWDDDLRQIVLVTSTFELVPGLPIYVSRDMAHWKHVSDAIDEELARRLLIPFVDDSGGVYAPTLRRIRGKYVIACTIARINGRKAIAEGCSQAELDAAQAAEGNFVLESDSIDGPWRGPFWIEGAEGIDPDIFEDEDGNALQKFARTGASPNAFTSHTVTAYHFSCTDRFEENLKILLKFVFTPYFTDENVEKERGIINQEIRMVEDTPNWEVFVGAYEGLYRNHPVRVSIPGSEESISHITPELLYTCHRAFYSPKNMALVVCGTADFEQVCRMAEEISPKDAPEIGQRHYGERRAEVHQPVVTRKMQVSLPQCMVGFKDEPVPAGESRLRRSLIGDLAVRILCGDTSPLYAKLYEKRLLGRDFDVDYSLIPDGACAILGGESRDPAAVREALERETARLAQEGIEPKLFRRMKNALYGMRLRMLDVPDLYARQEIASVFAGEHYLDFAGLFDTIHAEDVQEMFRRWAQPNRSTMSVVEPK